MGLGHITMQVAERVYMQHVLDEYTSSSQTDPRTINSRTFSDVNNVKIGTVSKNKDHLKGVTSEKDNAHVHLS